MDESGISTFMHRTHGWSKRGRQVFGKVSGQRFERQNMIAAWRDGEIIAPVIFPGTCDACFVEQWFEEVLLPCLNPGDVVILDNASFHKKNALTRILKKKKCKLLFLPPYSPELNPIETFWANLKRKIRSIAYQCSSLMEAMIQGFKSFSYKMS